MQNKVKKKKKRHKKEINVLAYQPCYTPANNRRWYRCGTAVSCWCKKWSSTLQNNKNEGSIYEVTSVISSSIHHNINLLLSSRELSCGVDYSASFYLGHQQEKKRLRYDTNNVCTYLSRSNQGSEHHSKCFSSIKSGTSPLKRKRNRNPANFDSAAHKMTQWYGILKICFIYIWKNKFGMSLY